MIALNAICKCKQTSLPCSFKKIIMVYSYEKNLILLKVCCHKWFDKLSSRRSVMHENALLYNIVSQCQTCSDADKIERGREGERRGERERERERKNLLSYWDHISRQWLLHKTTYIQNVETLNDDGIGMIMFNVSIQCIFEVTFFSSEAFISPLLSASSFSASASTLRFNNLSKLCLRHPFLSLSRVTFILSFLWDSPS